MLVDGFLPVQAERQRKQILQAQIARDAVHIVDRAGR
jgi:hypothetical protein